VSWFILSITIRDSRFTMPSTILLADDDTELSGLLKEYFESEGFHVRLAADGVSALEESLKPGLDLIVLDVMMPGMNGMDVLKELRKQSRLPVIMLTARGDDMDRILGLELGADDYVPKPCNPRELLARIRAVMRRGQVSVDHGVIAIDDLELNQGSRTLVKSGEAVELTSTEFSILFALLQDRGEVVSKRDLYMSALGREPVPHDRSVDMHVSNLRRKLGPDPRGDNRIETIRGIGYQYRVA
jgi:two-component system response regulator CpxR